MIRTGSCAKGLGSITVFYPDHKATVLVLRARFYHNSAQYKITRFGTFTTLLNFIVTDSGEKIPLDGNQEPVV